MAALRIPSYFAACLFSREIRNMYESWSLNSKIYFEAIFM